MVGKKKGVLEKALDLSMKNNTGVNKKAFGIQFDQREAFLQWLDARVKMARKPLGVSVIQVSCIPIAKEGGKDIPLERPKDIAFPIEEYHSQREDCRKLFLEAQQRERAQTVVAILINLGVAITKVLDKPVK